MKTPRSVPELLVHILLLFFSPDGDPVDLAVHSNKLSFVDVDVNTQEMCHAISQPSNQGWAGTIRKIPRNVPYLLVCVFSVVFLCWSMIAWTLRFIQAIICRN